MTGAAPWWASGDDGPRGDEDPLRSHLAARRAEPPRDDREPEADGPVDGDAPDPTPGGDHGPAICGVCPICRGWSAVSTHRPEVADHLVDAARALATALNHLADAAAAASDGPGAPPEADADQDTPVGFQPILLEDEG